MVIRSCRTIPCIRGARFLTAGIFICSSPALEVDCRVNLWIDSSSTFVIALLMAKNPGSVSGDSYQNSEFVIVHAFLQIKCLTPIMVRTASHAVGQMMLTMMKCLGKELSNLRYKFRLTTKAAFETLGCFHCSPFFFSSSCSNSHFVDAGWVFLKCMVGGSVLQQSVIAPSRVRQARIIITMDLSGEFLHNYSPNLFFRRRRVT